MMLKKLNKILLFFLVFVMILGSFTACSNNENKGNQQKPPSNEVVVENVKPYDTTVLFPEDKYEIDSSVTFIKNSTTEYKILIPRDARQDIKDASAVLKKYLLASTGASLEIVEEENGVVYNKVISLGYTEFFNSTDIAVTEDELGNLGHKIKTIGNNIFVAGYSEDGTLAGAYTLLSYLIGFRAYSKDEQIYLTNATEIPFYKLDITKLCVADSILINDNSMATDASIGLGGWIHPNAFYQIETGEKVREWHNTIPTLPREVYLEDHPDFYISTHTQISYVANGNKKEYDLMVDIVANSIIESAKANPYLKNVTFTHMDNTDMDWCDAAKEVRSKYGTDSALQILFLNDVGKKVKEWANSPDGGNGRKIIIYFLAYQISFDAPVTEVNGVMVPNQGITMEDNIGVIIAPLEFDNSISFYDKKNEAIYTVFKKWAALTKNIGMWKYSYFHGDVFMPYDVYGNVQSMFQFAREFSVEWILAEGRHGGGDNTYFAFLYNYLSGRLAYNPDLDLNKEIDTWFNYYFKDAQSYMRQYFDETRVWHNYLDDNYSIGGKIESVAIINADYWPYGLLTRWQSYIDQAYKSIEKYKSIDEVVYDKLSSRINLESLMIRYMLISFHENRFSSDELLAMKKQFRLDCDKLGVNCRNAAGTPLTDLWASWGIG